MDVIDRDIPNKSVLKAVVVTTSELVSLIFCF